MLISRTAAMLVLVDTQSTQVRGKMHGYSHTLFKRTSPMLSFVEYPHCYRTELIMLLTVPLPVLSAIL